MAKLKLKINSITDVFDEKTRIDLDYAKQDLERSRDSRIKLLIKQDLLTQQLSRELCKS